MIIRYSKYSICFIYNATWQLVQVKVIPKIKKFTNIISISGNKCICKCNASLEYQRLFHRLKTLLASHSTLPSRSEDVYTYKTPL